MTQSRPPKSPKQRSLRREVTTEAKQRLKAEVTSQRTMVQSAARSRLESLVPEPLRWVIPLILSFRGEDAEPEPTALPEVAEEPSGQAIAPAALSESLCVQHNPFTCEFAKASRGSDRCSQCGFSLLLEATETIAGRRGRYQVTHYLGERGMGRLYQAKRLSDGASVVIKEFLLSRQLATFERREKKSAFTRLAGVDAVDGKVSDYRLVAPWEAIADANRDRCYLVTLGNWDASITLTTYLQQYGAMSDVQVRRVLDQVLQTLEFLHEQKVRSPEGIVSEYGSVHGNITLNSLLYVPKAASIANFETQENLAFFIYVCDLAEWEFLFDITATQADFYGLAQKIAHQLQVMDDLRSRHEQARIALQRSYSARLKQAPAREQAALQEAQIKELTLLRKQQAEELAKARQQPLRELRSLQKADLKMLGYVGYSLLLGRVYTPTQKQALPTSHPRLEVAHPILRRVLDGLVTDQFETSTTARQLLTQMPVENTAPTRSLTAEKNETPWYLARWLWWLLGSVGLAFLLALIWLLLPKPQPQAIARNTTLLCGIDDVTNAPKGRFRYKTPENGFWSLFLKQRLLSRESDLASTCLRNVADLNEKFEPILQARQPNYQLVHQAIAATNAREVAISEVQGATSAFTVTSLTNDLPADLMSQTVAYDGLAIIVSFSYAKRDNSLPKRLNGQIRLTDLQRLYTGQIRNWRELGGPDLPVSLYVPDDDAAIFLFEQNVLKTQEQIRLFRQMLPKPTTTGFIRSGEMMRLPIGSLLQQVIRDFENELPQKGAIAFAPMSQVFGQCSVYPLAIAGGERAVQPLIQANGQPIDPSTDLCRNKGSYAPDVALFQSRVYPLAYDISVVYRRDNSLPPVGEKFAEMLQTQEGQSLLKQAGFIPIAEWKDGRR